MTNRSIGNQALLGKLPSWRELKEEAIRIGLSGTSIFSKFDDATIDKEFNYIGPDRMPEWIRLSLSKHHVCVLPAVLIHDLDFVLGGSEDEFHRCNKRLHHNMRLCVKAHRKEFTIVSYLWEKLQIRLMYLACERFGRPGWNLHQ